MQEYRRQAEVAPLEGTGGEDAARLIHCLNALLFPSAVPPSFSPPGIHLSPPGPGSLNDLGGGEGEGSSVEGRKLSSRLPPVVGCVSESEAPYGLPGSLLLE